MAGKDDLQWKVTFNGRQVEKEDGPLWNDLLWKIAFVGREPLFED